MKKSITIILVLIIIVCQVKGQDTTAQLMDLIPPNCLYTSGGNITLTATGGTTGIGETTQYILTDKDGLILQISNTPTFTNITTGGYIAYAISYETAVGISNLAIGTNIQEVKSIGCLDFSPPYSFTICPIEDTCDEYLDSLITLSSTGGITANATTKYILTDSTGSILQVQNTSIFNPLTHAGNYFAYVLTYSNTITVTDLSQGNLISSVALSDTCFDWSTPYIFQVCPIPNEICNNGIDDDLDGLTDCDDPDCEQPNIAQITPTKPSCPNLNNGVITISASGNNLEYSIDGTNFQSSNTFNNLVANSYTITVKNSVTGCLSTSLTTLTSPNCTEVCNNGIDDDLDGLIDCDDPDCGQPSISQVNSTDPTLVSCPNLNNGFIVVNASGNNLEYSIDGTNFQSSNTFNNLVANSYTITVKNSVTGCITSTSSTLIAPVCPVNPVPPLPIIPTTCTYTDVITVTLTATGGSNAVGETTIYALTDANGDILQTSTTTTFSNLTTTGYATYAVSYQTASGVNGLTTGNNIQNVTSNGCLDFSAPFGFLICASEICNNGIDDDLDGLIDCDDPDCGQPSISQVNSTDPTLVSCPNLNNGFIVVNASGNNLEYSIDGTNFQSSNTFNNLVANSYTITVKNSVTGCLSTSLTTLSNPNCTEVCNNGIDDDLDGLIDCDDPDCGQPSISQVNSTDPTLVSCPNLNNGFIVVNASGNNLEYSIDGTNFQNSNTFNSLLAGNYTITVKNSVTGCITSTSSTLIAPVCPVNPVPPLPIIPTTCTYTDVITVTLTATGGSNAVGETTIYALTDANGDILQTSTTTTFSNLTTTGYATYAVSYQTASGVNGLTTGNNIQNVTSNGCLDFSAPFGFLICASEICNNGIDDDLDGLIDCDDPDCGQPSISQVVPTNPSCPSPNNGIITVTATGNNLEYSINGTNFQSSNIFSNLAANNYTITVKNSITACITTSSIVLVNPTCIEICNNNIDDDGDGQVDCADPDCGQPSIIQVSRTNPTTLNCPTQNDGTIAINASGNNLEYSIDGTNYQSSPNFQNLFAGTYTVHVRNSSTGCIITSTLILTAPICPQNPIPELPISPFGCAFVSSSSSRTISLNASGGTNAFGEKTEYILTDLNGIILHKSLNATFANVTIGSYGAYAISYQLANGVNNLSIGNHIQSVTSTGCLDFSIPFSFNICPENSGCDFYIGDDVTVIATGGNAANNVLNYLLTDNNGQIIAINPSPNFPNIQAAGTYLIYALAYENNTTVNNLSVGQPLSNITFSDTCYDWSPPHFVQVCLLQNTNLTFTKSSVDTIQVGMSAIFTFTFVNNTGIALNNINFTDNLFSGAVFFSNPTQITGGLQIVGTGIGSNTANLIINQIPIGTSSFQLAVDIPNSLHSGDIYCNQAQITNLSASLSNLPNTLLSDNPNTIGNGDSTCIIIKTPEICNNGIDDDMDGLDDCEDPDCKVNSGN